MSEVQAIYGLNTEWSYDELLRELLKLGFYPLKGRIEGNEIRFRIREPTYSRYITKIGHHNGKKLYFVIGFR